MILAVILVLSILLPVALPAADVYHGGQSEGEVNDAALTADGGFTKEQRYNRPAPYQFGMHRMRKNEEFL